MGRFHPIYTWRFIKVWNKLYEQTLERAAASPLMYGLFALETQNESLIVGAKAQLGVI